MPITKETVFSEFFLDQIGLKLRSEEGDAELVDCVGKLSEEYEVKTITKSCRGRVKKSRTRPVSGTVTITMHIPYQLYLKLYAMKTLDGGVHGYGPLSTHPECALTARIKDEDDNVKYKAYPVASLTSKKGEIDDDADEVAMVELEFAVSADDSEMICYEVLEEELAEGKGADWMTKFGPEYLSGLAAE